MLGRLPQRAFPRNPWTCCVAGNTRPWLYVSDPVNDPENRFYLNIIMLYTCLCKWIFTAMVTYFTCWLYFTRWRLFYAINSSTFFYVMTITVLKWLKNKQTNCCCFVFSSKFINPSYKDNKSMDSKITQSVQPYYNLSNFCLKIFSTKNLYNINIDRLTTPTACTFNFQCSMHFHGSKIYNTHIVSVKFIKVYNYHCSFLHSTVSCWTTTQNISVINIFQNSELPLQISKIIEKMYICWENLH